MSFNKHRGMLRSVIRRGDPYTPLSQTVVRIIDVMFNGSSPNNSGDIMIAFIGSSIMDSATRLKIYID